MKVVLFGFEFASSNKGCEALTYSFFTILERCFRGEYVEIINITIRNEMGFIPQRHPNFKYRNFVFNFKTLKHWVVLSKLLRSSDVVFDITHGDSFSDIYGARWLIKTNLLKSMALLMNKRLYLMPQTYGPFKSKLLEKWAVGICKLSERIYCRDIKSENYLRKLMGNGYLEKVITYTDLAFGLPYERGNTKNNSNKIKIGINVSGLLWNDCENNNLELTVNYKEYCKLLIKKLLEDSKFDVYLIPHVICDKREGTDYFENDCSAIRCLKKIFPECIFESDFETAIDVKSYISRMDVLVAARMHASIAAYSSGVACIPFAYSRKFSGLYSGLGYDFIIEGQSETTVQAVEKTINFINIKDLLIQNSKVGMTEVSDKLEKFEMDLKNALHKR